MSGIPILKNAKKNGGNFLTMGLLVMFLVILVMGTVTLYNAKIATPLASSLGVDTVAQQKIEAAAAGVSAQDLASCNGVAAINLLYNDQNIYAAATDPATNLTITSPISKIVLDDATSTTVPIKSSLSVLIGNALGVPSTTYFSKEDVVNTACSDLNYQPQLYQAGAPTITITNDNGVTLNADGTAEAMDASSVYTPSMTIKAPANKASSVYGAAVVFNYPSTTVRSITSSDLDNFDTTILLPDATNLSQYAFNQFKVMKYTGQLLDGAKDEISFTVETTSTAPGEDESSVVVHWLPLNKDVNSEDLKTIITSLYDDTNSVIYIGNTTATYYTD